MTSNTPQKGDIQHSHARIKTISDIERLEEQPYDKLVPYRSVYDIFRLGAERFSERNAINFTKTGDPADPMTRYTYAEVLKRINQAANLFHGVGVGRNDAVGVLLPNIPATHFAIWGAETVGRVCPINFMLRTEHIVELLEASGAKVLVALGPDPDLDIWSKVVDIRTALPNLKLVCQVPGRSDPAPGVPDFMDLISTQNGNELDFSHRADRTDVAALYHTGGTTGAPKLALHTHGNQIHTSWSATQLYDSNPDDLMVNGFPLFHVAGSFVFGLSAYVAGAGLLLPTLLGMRNTTFLKNYWRFVEAENVTMLGCVPTVLAGLMNIPVDGADVGGIRIAWTGGSPLPTELANAFEKQTAIPVRNLFGMTESAGLISITPNHAKRVPGSVGLRLPYTDVRAFALAADGVDMTRPCAPDDAGVIAIRGPHISAGYSNKARNPGTFTDNGWLISGDLGWVDGDGNIFLTGRSKDVIIRGAHNIDPAMIEEAFDKHPAVEMCAAIGQPDAYAGELPMVYVTLKPGKVATEGELLEFVEPLIPERPAMPKRAVIIDEMPLTPIGKIYKPALRAQAMQDVVADVMKPLQGRGLGGVNCVDEGGKVTVEISVSGDEALEAEARALLRNFAIECNFV